jgi:hypothetical protein
MHYFLMREQGGAMRVFQLRDAVDEASVDHGAVEEFGIFLSLFKPLNPRFLSVENLFLFVSLFQFPVDMMILMLLS